MKSLFVYLSGLFLFALLVSPVIAQGINWEDYGLDEESTKNLSEQEKQEIIDQDQILFPVSDNNNQNLEDTSSNAEIVSCFDYYTFGSIDADFTSQSSDAVSGMKMNFSGNIVNKNSYPVVEGTLYVKIFKNIGSEKNPNGPDVVDQFIALDNINLPANGSVPAEFSWDVPAYATTGDYQLVTYFTSDKKFNLLGLSFTDDIVGNSFNFKVSGVDEIVMFDKSSVVINNNPYYFAAYPPRIQDANSAEISLLIENTTNATESAQVKWKLYAWDAMNPENLVREFETNTQVNANSRETVSFSIPEKEAPAYLLVGELQYKDTKSFVGIRYVRDGVDKVRLNYPAVTSYPLAEGQQTTLFTCLHNSGQSEQVKNNKVILEVLNKRGKVIESYVYEGVVTGAMMAVKKDFVPKANLDTFSVRASLYTDGKLVDESTMEYSCQDLDPTKCSSGMSMAFIQIIIGVVAFALLLVVLVLIKRKMRGIELMMLLFVVTAGMLMFDVGVRNTEAITPLPSNLVNPNITSGARQVVWNTTVGGNGFDSLIWDRRGATLDNSFAEGIDPKRVLKSPNITVKYNTKITNTTKDAVINDNDTVSVGDNLKLEFVPHHPYDIYWFGTGYAADSPYGEWEINAEPGDISCLQKDFISSKQNINSDRTVTIDSHLPLVISPPSKVISNINSNLSCGSLTGNETVGYSMDCVVVGPGEIKPTFNFDSTFGRFYFRYKSTSVYPDRTTSRCAGNNIPLLITNEPDGSGQKWVNSLQTFILNVPLKSITYTLNSIAIPSSNTPPNPPTITGPMTGVLTNGILSGNFNLLAIDPDGDQIKYQVDWPEDGVDLDIDQTLPGSGLANSGTQLSTSKNITYLPYTFNARAVDEFGAESTWSSFIIRPISCPNGSPIPSSGICSGSNTCPDGSPIPANGICTGSNTCPDGSVIPANGICSSGSLSVSCSASPVILNSQTTYNVSPQGAEKYEWFSNGQKVSETTSSYTKKYTTTGDKNDMVVKVSKDNTTKDVQCYAQVTCDNSKRPQDTTCQNGTRTTYSCGPTGWISETRTCSTDPTGTGGDPVVTTFKFEPALVNPNATDSSKRLCGLTLEASNVSKCELISSGANQAPVFKLPTIEGILLYSKNRIVPTGRYTLSCTGTGENPVTKTYGPQSCVGNPQFQED